MGLEGSGRKIRRKETWKERRKRGRKERQNAGRKEQAFVGEMERIPGNFLFLLNVCNSDKVDGIHPID